MYEDMLMRAVYVQVNILELAMKTYRLDYVQ